MSCPLLLLSDSVDSHSGLSRITRDIAMHASRLPEFRVATMGRGGRGTRRTPWPQYVIGDSDWGESYINEIWRDFAGNEPGVLMSVWDPSRIRWICDPNGPTKGLPIQRWAYVPLDAAGPNNRLTGVLADTISRFDRVLSYGMWGEDLIARSLAKPHRDLSWMPHGVNFKAFNIREKVGARMAVGLSGGQELAGVVMTNQQRKDWGLVAVIASELRKRRPQLRWWWHVDVDVRHYNLLALRQDYGLEDVVEITHSGMFNDTEMSYRYSACDITVLPSAEGFGYPIVESQACGTPVIHSFYGGGAELIERTDWKIEPLTYRMEGQYNSLRPVFEPKHWVDKVDEVLNVEWDREEIRRSVSHLDWTNLRTPWEKWLKLGVGL